MVALLDQFGGWHGLNRLLSEWAQADPPEFYFLFYLTAHSFPVSRNCLPALLSSAPCKTSSLR
jgi:hypothetical protein